jgi:hypothetical protein
MEPGTSLAEMDALGHKFAAADEMLEALKDIAELRFIPGGFDQENVDTAIRLAIEAIDRAEGKAK